MPSITRTLAFSALLAFANAQGAVQKAVGEKGTSAPLQLDVNNPADANFISDAEIRENMVNACGRTAAGNIDIGETSEINLSKNAVTTVKKGSNLVLTIKQGGSQGAGPYDCDLDLTNNSNGLTGQTKLTTKETKNGDNIEVTATMPNNMTCIGGSTGDLCMVRCRNKQNFGGCVAIQQTDITAHVNTVDNIKTAATAKSASDQVKADQRDFETTSEAIATASLADQGAAVAKALVEHNTANGVLKDQNTTRVAAPAASTSGAAKKNTGGKKKGTANAKGGKKNNNAANAKGAKANGNGGDNNGKNNNKKRELFKELIKEINKRLEAEADEQTQPAETTTQAATEEGYFDDEE
ncbi:hypothetical protein MCOR25_009496 [Pyricularia grisea]|uniref:GEgh 16 protein n=1 Tax=Pyricularia grisea TaxID=148305 RepID=A0A6P8AV41_PYRGI|nr:uncharacterized protein PgNI_08254 [Pyricularia grisea]KAI6352193.1 hypothetical protein MCOR25_009496 [Pyricularia grisea]TLD06082.1 hypothetical protein PgNI_08254 [Pyricularia grisea]